MKPFRFLLITALSIGLTAPAFAGDLRDSIAAAAATAAAEPIAPDKPPANKLVTLGGAAIFATGMVVGLNAFINNKNGKFSEFGEADAVNKKLGAAGIGMAFGGGMMMLLGHHGKSAPTLSISGSRVTLGKAVSW